MGVGARASPNAKGGSRLPIRPRQFQARFHLLGESENHRASMLDIHPRGAIRDPKFDLLAVSSASRPACLRLLYLSDSRWQRGCTSCTPPCRSCTPWVHEPHVRDHQVHPDPLIDPVIEQEGGGARGAPPDHPDETPPPETLHLGEYASVVLRVDDYEELRSRYGADALEDAVIDLDLKAKLEPSLYPEHKHGLILRYWLKYRARNKHNGGKHGQQREFAAQAKQRCIGSSLTIEELRFWFAALMGVSLDRVQKVITYWLTVKRSRFFPNVPEFLDAMEEWEADPVAHERAYRKLFAEYEQAYLEGRVPQSLCRVIESH
jgi:hypothetical protein